MAAPQAPRSEERALKERLAEELHFHSSALEVLKGNFYNRQFNHGKLIDAGAVAGECGGIAAASPADTEALGELRRLVAAELLDPATTLPIDADALHMRLLEGDQAAAYRRCMAQLRQPELTRLVAHVMALEQRVLGAQLLTVNGRLALTVTGMDRAALARSAGVPDPLQAVGTAALNAAPRGASASAATGSDSSALPSASFGDWGRPEQGGLQEAPSVSGHRRCMERLEQREELLELLGRKTAREREALQAYQTGGAAVREPCRHLTAEACRRARGQPHACHRVHMRKQLHPWTDESLGDCRFLGNCHKMRCKFVHYVEDDSVPAGGAAAEGGAWPVGAGAGEAPGGGGFSVPRYLRALPEPQWVNCDVRTFDFSVLGKFGVIMTDPPWTINQDVPYGTLGDEEIRNMAVGDLQDDGVIFMWVTTRALEAGRDILARWGYRRTDELVWVKINPVHRLIREGRTGHWLNHTKEHCLVGYKGNPRINRFIDCDVLVSEVREPSRKPDEMYPLLERLSPDTRKLEIFARRHNVRPGWVSVGNQLDGTHITDPDLMERYVARYGRPKPPVEPVPRAGDWRVREYGGDW